METLRIPYATWTDPPLNPGSDYYFTYAHRNGVGMWASISASTARLESGSGAQEVR